MVLNLQKIKIQMGCDVLNRWSETKQEIIWYGQVQVLHVCASDQLHKCRMGSLWLGGCFAGKAGFILRNVFWKYVAEMESLDVSIRRVHIASDIPYVKKDWKNGIFHAYRRPSRSLTWMFSTRKATRKRKDTVCSPYPWGEKQGHEAAVRKSEVRQ